MNYRADLNAGNAMSDQDCIPVVQQFLDTSTGSKLTFFRALYGKVSDYLDFA